MSIGFLSIVFSALVVRLIWSLFHWKRERENEKKETRKSKIEVWSISCIPDLRAKILLLINSRIRHLCFSMDFNTIKFYFWSLSIWTFTTAQNKSEYWFPKMLNLTHDDILYLRFSSLFVFQSADHLNNTDLIGNDRNKNEFVRKL